MLLALGCRERRPGPWLGDYQALRANLTAVYADLERTPVDLARLDDDTRRALAAATSAVEARVVLEGFLAAFRDPRLRPRPARPRGSRCAPPGTPGTVIWPRVEGWRALGGGAFEHGVIAGARPLGVIRVPSFLARHYPEVCEAEGDATRRLSAEFGAALAAVRSAGAANIVVDITGNGGGDEAVYELASLLLGEPARCGRALVVDKRCDRSPLWRGEKVACRSLVELDRDPLSCSRRDVALPPRPERIVVLVDRRTSGSAELFAALLVEQGGARVAGEPTAGAGCGGPGAAIALPRTGLTVEVPDCATRVELRPDVLLAGDDWTPAVAPALAAAASRE